MFKTIEETMEWLGKWDVFSMKLGLERMHWLLEHLGHPERQLRAIHVGGTNGKGSTVRFLASVLEQAGYTVGTFTSPSLISFNDRISLNSEAIKEDDMIKVVNLISPSVEALEKTEHGAPTEFEVMTLMAIVYFAKVAPCDFAIFEVGLGGRYDSTNVLFPLVSVITNVTLDHMKQLGNTPEKIAWEKAGIIKTGTPIITGAEGGALDVIVQTAKEKQARIYRYGREFAATNGEQTESGEIFDFVCPFKTYKRLNIRMFGEHQIKNASCALMVLQYLNLFYAVHIDENALRQGMERAFWPGRMEILSKHPLVILDGAHNEAGMAALVQAVRRHYSNYKVTVLFASLEDKDNQSLIEQVTEIADHFVLTTFDHYRAADPTQSVQWIPKAVKTAINPSWRRAFEDILESLGKQRDQLLLVTGSIYFIAKVRQVYKQSLT
ncbi:bifunctional folylpolyglutamate synthase/dihydrofolate synthase [Camelliibacillus cellulosilyticus]|uniref:tetrahydrofolate synthase n=1 Tax=Camelliibacillus cellulosilyticus TaxID=2174486 RepID=A0ABV9GMJ7_9BACL